MQRPGRLILILVVALAVPIVPFLLWQDAIEQRLHDWLTPPPADSVVFLAVIAVLSSDILLPVPSSFVSTLAGAQLGIVPATLASWIGLTVGASLGFALARWLGRPLAERFSSTDDLNRMESWSQRFGPRILVITRALPVLAEASVLLLGTTQLSWRRFLPPVMLANLGIALAYSILGHFGREQNTLFWVLLASIAVPLLATLLLKYSSVSHESSDQ